MSSKKGKDKIRSSVEASILDAVTKIQVDEVSNGQYDRTKHDSAPKSVVIQDRTAQHLWDLVKESSAQRSSDDVKYLGSELIKKVEEKKVVEDTSTFLKINVFDSKVKDDEKNEEKDENPAKNLVDNVGANLFPPKEEKSELKTLILGSSQSKNSEYTPQSESEYKVPQFESFNILQMKLLEGDHLKIAQNRIEELERNLERMRVENEKLSTAADLFQRRSEENVQLRQEIEKKLAYNEERMIEERNSLQSHIEKQDESIREHKEKIEELESRLSSDIRKSRSRERELENRLELARMEKISLVGSKDEIILDLKRQVDQLNHELGGYRRKAAQMNQALEANQEQFRRTVRALRLALTNLEVNDKVGPRNKKAE